MGCSILKYTLTQAEEEILGVLWQEKKWMSCSELVVHFNKTGKCWKRQTINTLLVRLMDKGFVVKNGRQYIYALTKEEFDSLKASELVETYYGGSLKRFISAFLGQDRTNKTNFHRFAAAFLGQETSPREALEEIEMLEKIINERKEQLKMESKED